MRVQLKAQHIYFALESIWNGLDYKFKYAVNQEITALAAAEAEQGQDKSNDLVTLNVTPEIVRQILDSVNEQAQGVAREINPAMFMDLLPQVQAAAQQGDAEAVEILQLMSQATDNNNARLAEKIDLGKRKILA